MDVSVPEAAGIFVLPPQFESGGLFTEKRIQPVLIRSERVSDRLRQAVLPGKGVGSAVEGVDLFESVTVLLESGAGFSQTLSHSDEGLDPLRGYGTVWGRRKS